VLNIAQDRTNQDSSCRKETSSSVKLDWSKIRLNWSKIVENLILQILN